MILFGDKDGVQLSSGHMNKERSLNTSAAKKKLENEFVELAEKEPSSAKKAGVKTRKQKS